MVFHILSHLITLSLLKLIQPEDMAEYTNLSLCMCVSTFLKSFEFDVGISFVLAVQ